MASNNFINECKNRANANRLGSIIIDGITNSISNSNNLQSFSIDSGCCVNGNIVGTVYAKCLKANFIAEQNNLTDKNIQAKIGVKYADLSTEYINMGKYKVERPNNEITANMSQITAYDSLYTNLDDKYVCNIDYSIGNKTLKDLYIDVCNQLGLTSKTTNILNGDIPISNNPFTNGEKNRTVLETVAKVSCSFIDIDNDTNKIDLCWLSQNEEPDYIFYKNDYSSVDGGQVVCGPINCLIIKNSVLDDENITIKDEESIALYGEHSLTINEDYILYSSELRNQAINAIWNRVKGMKYVDCKLTTYYGKPFLKLGNKIRIYTSETEYFDTYVLKHQFTYDGTFQSIIESPALTEQEIKNKQNVSLKETLYDTQVKINKQNQTIEAFTKKVENETTPVAEASGEELKLVNSAGEDLIEFRIDGKTTQKQTPSNQHLTKEGWSTPAIDGDYWNLLSNVTSGYIAKSTPLSDGWIKLEWDNTNGTESRYTNLFTNKIAIDIKPDTTYTFVIESKDIVKEDSLDYNFRVAKTHDTDTAFKTAVSRNISELKEGIQKIICISNTQELIESSKYGIRTYLGVPVGAKGSMKVRLSILEGDHKNDEFEYTPYTGEIVPNFDYPQKLNDIADSNILKLISHSKNMFNPNGQTRTVDDITITNNEDGTFTMSAGTTIVARNFPLSTAPIYLEKGKTYTQSVIVTDGNLVGNVVPSFKRDDGTFINNYFNNNSTKTAEENLQMRSYNLYIQAGKTIEQPFTFKVQLEESDHATEYEPYRYLISEIDIKQSLKSLSNGTHDELYVNNGQGIITKRVVEKIVNGSENWKNTGTELNNTYRFKIEGFCDSYTRSELCSHFRYQFAYNLDEEHFYISHETYSLYVFVNKDRFTSESNRLAEFKQMLADNPITVYCELEEPEVVLVDDLYISTVKGNSTMIQNSGLTTNMSCTYVRDTAFNSAYLPQSAMKDYYTISETDSKISISENGILNQVRNVETKVNNDYYTKNQVDSSLSNSNSNIASLKEQMTTLEQLANQFSIQITSINQNGVSKINTGTGYVFDQDGLNISKTGEDFSVLINNLGLYTYKNNNEVVLKADTTGVETENLTVRTYLIKSNVIREESYEDEEYGIGIADFWVGD